MATDAWQTSACVWPFSRAGRRCSTVPPHPTPTSVTEGCFSNTIKRPPTSVPTTANHISAAVSMVTVALDCYCSNCTSGNSLQPWSLGGKPDNRRWPEKILNNRNQRKCVQEIPLLRSLCFDTIHHVTELCEPSTCKHTEGGISDIRDARNISASLKELHIPDPSSLTGKRCRTWCVPLHIWKHRYTCSEDILRLVSSFADILVWIPLMFNVSHVINESMKKPPWRGRKGVLKSVKEYVSNNKFFKIWNIFMQWFNFSISNRLLWRLHTINMSVSAWSSGKKTLSSDRALNPSNVDLSGLVRDTKCNGGWPEPGWPPMHDCCCPGRFSPTHTHEPRQQPKDVIT